MLFSAMENANTADGERLMVDLELDDGLAIITIDRPHARNAISLETMDQLDKALDGAEGARALVLTGAGDRAFVSGGDLKELAALRTEWDASTMAFRMRSICDRIAGFPTPTIAVLNGHALGGGAEFAVAADIRLAADDIKIGFNQVTLEIMPAWGGAERLVALVGYSKALLLAGTGTVLDPSGRRDQARHKGSVHNRGRRGLRTVMGVRRTLGRRRQGDEARQVIRRSTPPYDRGHGASYFPGHWPCVPGGPTLAR